MVQDVVLAIYAFFKDAAALVQHLLPTIAATAVALLAIWLAVLKWAPEKVTALSNALSHLKPTRFVGAIAICVLFTGAFVQGRKLVENRRETLSEASASRKNEPNLSPVEQYSPRVSVLQDRTYTRTLTLPPSLLERVGVEGVQVLSPYLTDPSAENVTKMVDSFRRSGTDVVFTREVTRRDEVPVSTQSAIIQVDFSTEGGSTGRKHFVAQFDGKYKLRNDRAELATMSFTFPIPTGGGALEGLELSGKGTRITDPDENQQYTWTGQVAPGESVEIEAKYRLTGGGNYQYWVGSDRRRTEQFSFVAKSDSEPQFSRNGLFPAKVNGNSAEWDLNNVITFQSIALVFPRADVAVEILDKTLFVQPLILIAFALGCLFLKVERPLGSVAGFGMGMLATPVLSSYASPLLATIAGGVLAALLGSLALRSRSGAILATSCGVLSLIFLSVQHGTLIAWLLLTVGIVLVVNRRRA